jgi:hypothetical protein
MRKQYSEEQIVKILAEAETGLSAAEVDQPKATGCRLDYRMTQRLIWTLAES